eukprot:scaffold13317_cov28-Prasinocladus_malaysianus.AAC.1
MAVRSHREATPQIQWRAQSARKSAQNDIMVGLLNSELRDAYHQGKHMNSKSWQLPSYWCRHARSHTLGERKVGVVSFLRLLLKSSPESKQAAFLHHLSCHFLVRLANFMGVVES